MHFFNPVDRMELVEVIRGEKTRDETVATVVALAKQIRKTPIVVKDCAGFLVNRVLLPYMNEALQLLQEGVPMDAIDEAATRFGMPMGPIALHDLVGLDTAAYRRQGDDRGLPRPGRADPAAARPGQGRPARAEVGRGVPQALGQEGRGRPGVRPDPGEAPDRARRRSARDEITDRLFLPMLLEATRVLEEGIVREPADVDMGLILGIGFPPFRGGILRWADTVGAGEILERLEPLRPLGKRFEPTETLIRHAATGETFYPAAQARPRPSDRIPLASNTKGPSPMRHAVVIDAVRTPVGRASSDKGYYRDVRSEDLSAHVIRALVERTGIDPKLIEDVRWGCVQQQGEQGFDVARIASLVAGLPIEVGRGDDQPQLRVEPPGDQRRGHEHRRRAARTSRSPAGSSTWTTSRCRRTTTPAPA